MDIKELRKELGLTQAAMAKEVGATIATVQNWEKGRPISPVFIDAVNRLRGRLVQSNVKGSNIVHASDSETIAVLVRQIREKDAQLREKDNQLKEKDSQISRLLLLLERHAVPAATPTGSNPVTQEGSRQTHTEKEKNRLNA